MRKKIFVLFAMAALAASLVAIPAAHAQDMTPPTVPTGISAYITQSGQVYVSWNPSTDDIGVVGYYLYRDGQLVANTPGLLFFTDNAPAGTHAYTVAAYDAAGNISGQSPASSLVTVVADTTPPTAPTGLTLVPSSSSIALSWIASTDNVAVIERDLMSLYPQESWGDLTDVFIAHGRATCDAKKPLCEQCVITKYCRYFRELNT